LLANLALATGWHHETKGGRHSKNGDTTNLTNQNEDIMGHTIIQPAHLYILGLKIGIPPSDHLNGKKYDKPMDSMECGFPIFKQTQMKYKLEKEIGPGLQT